MFTYIIQSVIQLIINNLIYIAAFFLGLSMLYFIFGEEDKGAIYLALLAIGCILLFNIIG
jgi:4-amino-4-deoxy-L-arabinose transferase-like glycosyltransferase